ncbi:MAG: hypothetical protein OXH86_15390 [Acidimicrobiaceae bacterium]|nr:hypothetical protein [Acidimicrobiaceae bacterium]
MKSETLLPLGKLDPGLRAPDVPLDVTTIGDAAAQVEALGYDALVVEETKDDPYQLLAMAAVATSTDEATQAAVLSKAQRWDEISAIVSDEMLHTIATVGTYDQIGGLLGERYGPHIDRIEFSIPVNTPDDGEQLSAILAELGRAERS